MLHPSYSDLMRVVNSDVENGEEPVVNSRYSIVMATSKRARQIIDGSEPLVKASCDKPFSIAVEELYQGKVKILGDGEDMLEDETAEQMDTFKAADIENAEETDLTEE